MPDTFAVFSVAPLFNVKVPVPVTENVLQTRVPVTVSASVPVFNARLLNNPAVTPVFTLIVVLALDELLVLQYMICGLAVVAAVLVRLMVVEPADELEIKPVPVTLKAPATLRVSVPAPFRLPLDTDKLPDIVELPAASVPTLEPE